jgi:hypothetical protein
VSAALIVIEVAAPSVSDEALSVLVAACTRVARDAECVLAKKANDDPAAAAGGAVAIVSQQGDDHLRVEVGLRQGDHDSWRTKDFAFLASDEVADRWRAVGFAIGTLAESNPPAPEAEAVAPAPEKTPTPPSVPTIVAPQAPITPKPKETPKLGPQLFVGAALIFGPGLDSGPWRLGSALYADLALQRLPIFFTLGGSGATRVTSDANEASARWFDISSGAGVRLLGGLSSSGLELRAQALAEEFDVSVSAPDGSSQGRGRWLFGVEGELAGRVQVVPDLCLTAGVTALDLSSATDVHVAGNSIGSAASFRYFGSFGLRVRLR